MRDVGAGVPVGLPGQPGQVDARDRTVLEVVAEHALARGGVRREHEQGPVEPAGAPQRAVHVPRVVGGCQQEHAVVVARDVVQLEQQLVDGAAHRRVPQLGPLLPDRVHLVEEQHAGRVPPGDLEQLVDVALALPDEHVDDVGERYRDEPGAELARHRAGDERLAAARRPVEQQPAAQRLAVEPAQLRVAHRGQEGRLQALLHLGHPGHVGERQAGLLRVVGVRFVDARRGGILGLPAADEHRGQHVAQLVLGLRPVIVRRLARVRARRGGVGYRRCSGRPGPFGRNDGGISGRTLQQAEGLGVARVALKDRAELPDRLVPLAGLQQHRRQVQAKGHVVGHRLDGLAQAVQHGRFGFHASVRSVGFRLARPLTG